MLDENEHLQASLLSEGKSALKGFEELIKARKLLKGDNTSAGDTRQKGVYISYAKQLRDIAKNIKEVNDATVLLAQDYMPYIDVPAVVGMTQVNAETAIMLAGFIDPSPDQSKPNPNVDFRTDGGIPGLVLEVSPVAGTAFARSRQITIIVSQT